MAFKFLQDAIDKAIDPETAKPVAIWVRGGSVSEPVVYRPDQGANVNPNSRYASFRMRALVRLYGGFAGNEENDPENRGFNSRRPYERITLLSGEIGDPNNPQDNSFHVVTANGVPATAIIDGFHIRHGRANGGPSDPLNEKIGGGLIIEGDGGSLTQPTILRCVFSSNWAVLGGAAAVYGPQFIIPTFWNCEFKQNFAYNGGAVATNLDVEFIEPLPAGVAPVFYNCLFDQNETSGRGGAAAISLVDTPRFVNCTIVRNTSASWGGGLFHKIDDIVDPTLCNLDGHGGIFLHNTIVWGNVCQSCQNAPEKNSVRGIMEIRNSTVQHLGYPCWHPNPNQEPQASYGNFKVDPCFENFTGGDFRIKCTSKSVNSGVLGWYGIGDPYDLDQDGITSERTPDLALLSRVVGVDDNQNLRIDMGAYEHQYEPRSCPADIAGGSGTPDGVVNVSDLLAVINAWGDCPYDCNTCAADINVDPCGDGKVNVADLLKVINSWGECGGMAREFPVTLAECEGFCEGLEGADWQNCMLKCYQTVCDENPSECE